MVFSSIPFLYAFLPAVLLAYFIAPKRLKNTVLLLSSLIFYYIGEQRLVLVMLFSAAFNFFAALLIEKTNINRRVLMLAAVAVNIGILTYYKYVGFFAESVNELFGLSIPLLDVALPVGISFYTFQTMSYVIDVYRKKVKANRSFVDFATYVTLFPQLIAGPIVRYEAVESELKSRTHDFEGFAYGVRRFVCGLSKKVLIANTFAGLIKEISYSDEKTVLFAWMSAGAFTLQIYFDFSGYSDMAIGLGRMFGFRFYENFKYPYISSSITEFWRRWHISLGSWFRDYVYIPLGGNRVKLPHRIVNIMLVWLLTGLWHGARYTFVIWGLIYGVLLLGEKFIYGKRLQKIPRVFGTVYTLLFVVFGFVLFSADNLNAALESIKAMLGFASLPLYGVETLYNLKSYAIVFVISCLAATPLVPKLIKKMNIRIINTAEPLLCCALLLLCTGYLIDGSFNPFLYFRF